MLEKLNHYGIRGNALNWFESYLNNRKQFVTYNNVKSSMKTIKCGVPQGSILGPLLFLIYINDLVNICKNTTPFLFADDTNLFKNGTDLNDIAISLNSQLNDISVWLKVNKLSLNVKKTHYMIFTKKRQTVDSLDIKIDGIGIDKVLHTKFRGVFIDDKLNWKKHISYISGKISRGLGVIIKARMLLSEGSLKTLYYSFLYPYFTYCNHVWGNTSSTNLKPLVVLQKRCVRIITSSKRLEHTEPLFEKLGLLRFHDINKYVLSKFLYRWFHKDLPPLFFNIFVSVTDIHNHGTRHSSRLYCPKVKTDLGKSKFTYRGPFLWNKILDAKINPDTSEYIFSKSIKQCLKVGIL